MISTADVVSRIRAHPAPVLLCDACALLDVTRDPTREAFSAGHAEAARRLIERAEPTPPTLWLPLASQVLTEIHDNRLRVRQGAEAALRSLESSVTRVRSIMAAHGLNTSAIVPGLVESKLSDRTDELLTRYLQTGLHVEQKPDIAERAFARIAANLAPSQKGQQAKDCAIIETYLDVTRQLREASIDVTVVFFTTNKNDYSAQDDKAAVHPDLLEEFNAVGLRYAVNFQMAEHILE